MLELTSSPSLRCSLRAGIAPCPPQTYCLHKIETSDIGDSLSTQIAWLLPSSRTRLSCAWSWRGSKATAVSVLICKRDLPRLQSERQLHRGQTLVLLHELERTSKREGAQGSKWRAALLIAVQASRMALQLLLLF